MSGDGARGRGAGGSPADAGVLPTAPISDAEVARLRRAPSRLPRLFSPKDVVADRYRIVKFLAEGGMGEVYEAEDLQLHERVALKTIRPDRASSDAFAIERFKREIAL